MLSLRLLREAQREPRATRRHFSLSALNVTDSRGVAEGGGAVGPGGEEFLGDEAGEAGIENGAHDRGVVDLLVFVEFAAAGNTGGMVMADEVLVFAEAADDIAVHDLNVIDVEEQLHAR